MPLILKRHSPASNLLTHPASSPPTAFTPEPARRRVAGMKHSERMGRPIQLKEGFDDIGNNPKP
jgi:hypothetical protein